MSSFDFDIKTVEAEITFLSKEQGGRTIMPANLSSRKYRPHIVIGDPNQRQAIIKDNTIQEEYIGVAFFDGPDNINAGEPFHAVLALIYELNYSKLVVGSSFTVREGGHIVGYGRITKGYAA